MSGCVKEVFSEFVSSPRLQLLPSLDIRKKRKKKPTPEERFHTALFSLLLESDHCIDISSTIVL